MSLPKVQLSRHLKGIRLTQRLTDWFVVQFQELSARAAYHSQPWVFIFHETCVFRLVMFQCPPPNGLFKQTWFFDLPPCTRDPVTWHTHMFEIYEPVRIFCPTLYLQFGLGLRSIPLFYVELLIFEKCRIFRLLFVAETNWPAGFTVQ